MEKVKGIPISKGIVIGSTFVLEEKFVEVTKEMSTSVEEDQKAFHQAREKSISELEKIKQKMSEELGEEEAAIFGAHIELLGDFEFINQVEEEIKTYEVSCAWAVQTVGNRLMAMFEGMDNAYFRERAADIKDISQRVLRNIIDSDSEEHSLVKPSIIVAKDLSPSETSSLDKSLVLGIITEMGGKTSHSAIIARLLGIPFAVLEDATSVFEKETSIILNGETGDIIISPDADTISDYENKQAAIEAQKERYRQLKGKPALTSDGVKINLMANIGSTADLVYVKDSDAEGVGLFRTEFIFMDDKHLPTEEEQFEIYKEVLVALDGKPVTFRTLDIGGDKENPLFNIPKEMNPFLGLRGIRLCFKEQDIFKTQLRAILRASVFGKGKIMFPMISAMEELYEAKEILEIVKNELKAEGIDFSDDVPVGMMMETPSATIRARAFASEVDFFSIGTNDLVQYTMAVDRMNNSVADLYSVFDPAVIASLRLIVGAANDEGISVSVCGESAADPLLTPFWVSVGVNTLSMTANAIDEVKWNISHQKGEELRADKEMWLQFKTKDEVTSYLKTLKAE